jgi:hypothetical protein
MKEFTYFHFINFNELTMGWEFNFPLEETRLLNTEETARPSVMIAMKRLLNFMNNQQCYFKRLLTQGIKADALCSPS